MKWWDILLLWLRFRCLSEEALLSFGFGSERLTVGDLDVGRIRLMFLVHSTLQQEHIDNTCDVLRTVMVKTIA
jgi:hypothetical protein